MNESTLVLGAVAYDPKVVTIWEGFKRWFGARGLSFDYVLYSNYESQVEAHLAGDIKAAWNSPLAFVEVKRAAAMRGGRAEAIAMRDTDQNLTSVIVVRADGPRTIADLRGKVVATGAADSPQATILPLLHLAAAGLTASRDFEVHNCDVLSGKHGDHIGGERDAAIALMVGDADAACILDANHMVFSQEGIFAPGETYILAQTAPYDHCNFTVLDDVSDTSTALVTRFRSLLLGMSYADEEARALMDLEGLKAWVPGRVSGYAQLERAVDRFGTIDAWLAKAR